MNLQKDFGLFNHLQASIYSRNISILLTQNSGQAERFKRDVCFKTNTDVNMNFPVRLKKPTSRLVFNNPFGCFRNGVIFICCVLAFTNGCFRKPKGPPLPPQREYASIDAAWLYQSIMPIFKREGFDIAEYDDARKYFRTNWIEPAQNADTANTVRRRFEVFIERDRFLEKNYYLILHLEVQEKMPGSSGWRDVIFDEEKDEQFQRILYKIDQVVETGVAT